MIYVIYNMTEVASINFSEVVESSQDTLRLSSDKSKAVLKFVGETPSFLEGLQQYNHSEIIAIMQTEEWSKRDEI